VGAGKTVGHSTEHQGVVVGGLGECLDQVVIGPYGGSRATREKTARRRNQEPTRSPTQER
jgi:hypothetical protein